MNEILNGIALPSSNHLTGHGAYNISVREVLIDMDIGTISNNIAFSKLEGFITYLNNLIVTR